MRIACLGNTNHNLFALTRHLRKRGHDADLLVFNTEAERFHPAADTYNLEFQQYTRLLDWGDLTNFINVKPAAILQDLAPYDFLIGCGPSPAYLHKAGRALDIYSPYGSDLYEMTKYKYQTISRNFYKNIIYQLNQYRMAKAQRRGISFAHYILNNNEKWTPYYHQLDFSGEHLNLPIPQVFTPSVTSDSMEVLYFDPPAISPLRSFIKGYDISIFHGSRHVWPGNKDRYALKGNDRLVRGVAQFIKGNSAVRVCLIMCEYGPDVANTKELVRELGIEDHVFWLRKLRRKDILKCLGLVDLVACEFELSWLGGGTLYEALAMAKPVMQYRDDSLYKAAHEELPPILNVREPEEISMSLSHVVKNPGYYTNMGEKGRDWYFKHVEEPTLNAIEALIENDRSRVS